jgi:HIRAN domain
VGLLTRFMRAILGPPTPAASARTQGPSWPKPDEYQPHGHIRVVGESQYQTALRAIHRELRQGGCSVGKMCFDATLRPEPSNVVDPNAIQVLGPKGEVLGYLERHVAKQYHARLAIVGAVECRAQLHGGAGKKPSIGVVLEWTTARERLRAVAMAKSFRRRTKSADDKKPSA